MHSYTFFYRTCPDSDYKMFIVQRTTYSLAVSRFISFMETLKTSFRDFTGFYHRSSNIDGTVIDCMEKNDFDSLLSITCSNKDILQ